MAADRDEHFYEPKAGHGLPHDPFNALVGPRPITAQELRRYGAVRWHYLSVTPGVTGLWQVSGRNNLSYAERVALDRRYVEERSAGMGLNILFRTVDVVLRGHGAR